MSGHWVKQQCQQVCCTGTHPLKLLCDHLNCNSYKLSHCLPAWYLCRQNIPEVCVTVQSNCQSVMEGNAQRSQTMETFSHVTWSWLWTSLACGKRTHQSQSRPTGWCYWSLFTQHRDCRANYFQIYCSLKSVHHRLFLSLLTATWLPRIYFLVRLIYSQPDRSQVTFFLQ